MQKSTEILILEKLNKIEAVQVAQGKMLVDVQGQNVSILSVLNTMLEELQNEGANGEMVKVLEGAFSSMEALTEKIEKLAGKSK